MDKPLVTMTSDFIATKFPGYFFNTVDGKLYSMKMDGVLKPLKYHRPNPFNHIGQYPTTLRDGTAVYSKGGYRISYKGQRKFYSIEALRDLPEVASVIPVRDPVYVVL